jgi:uncharacterized protein YjdB
MTKHLLPRRLGAVVLALALILSQSVFAFADDDDQAATNPSAATEQPSEADEAEEAKPTLTLSAASLNMSTGTFSQLTATVTPADTPVTWTSSDTEIVNVDNEGKLQAIMTGKATITAAAGDLTATCAVEVFPAVQSVDLDQASIQLNSINDKMTLVGTVYPTTALDTTIKWSSEDTSVATVDENGVVTAVSAGQTTVYAASNSDPDKKLGCIVTVSGIQITKGGERVTSTIEMLTGDTINLALKTFGSAQYTGADWSSNDNSVIHIASGRVNAVTAGKATITAEVTGGFKATCDITVSENTKTLLTLSKLESGDTLKFSDIRSKLNDKCKESTNASLTSITNLSVPTDEGILFYNYVSPDNPGLGIGATETYYYSSTLGGRQIDEIVFVPATNYEGTVEITFTGTSSEGSRFSGRIRMDVEGSSDITYATTVGTPVSLEASNFSTVCKNRNGRDLSYVTFTLPASTRGTLYYNYTAGAANPEKVTETEKYYRTRAPYIDNISFVPAESYTGTVTIRYQAVDTTGAVYNGRISITVSSNGGSSGGDVTYSGRRGRIIHFTNSDFNSACRKALSETLDHVLFQLPSSSQGTLYYNYSSSSSYGSTVSESTRYYRSGSPSISNVAFMPASTASDTVSIKFTAYSTNGNSFTGYVTINLSGSSSSSSSSSSTSVSAVTYSVLSGHTVNFHASDFASVCSEDTGSTLNYVRFTLPSSTYGVLYENYSDSKSSNTKVTSSTSYYRSSGSHLIDDVSFVASDTYSGTMDISYTGRTTSGKEIDGVVTIRVTESTVTPLSYTGSSSGAISLSASDLRSVCVNKTGRNLSYIRFTSLPDSSTTGRLVADYSTVGSGTTVTVGTNYYDGGNPDLSHLAFIPKAGYSGTVSIGYAGVDTYGESYTGTISIVVVPTSSSRFSDMDSYSWAVPAVEYLASGNIVSGTGGTLFSPAQAIRRCDFVVMLVQAFGFTSTGTGSFPDVSSGTYYAQAVATAKSLGIVDGENGLFYPSRQLTRQEAMVMLYRAMSVSGQTVSVATDNLSSFIDGSSVSTYARQAVSTMVQMGIIQGDQYKQLKPFSSITRAEAAVMLYRILTQ